MFIRSAIFASMSIGLLACGASQETSQSSKTASVASSPSLQCDPSVGFSVCEGIDYLQKALADNSAVNGVGISNDARSIRIFTQALNPQELQMKEALIAQGLLELHFWSRGKVFISQDGKAYYRSSFGIAVLIVTENIGEVTISAF